MYGLGAAYFVDTIRYHRPVFRVLNFLKPKFKSIQRTIWKYDQGNFNELRNSLTNFNLNCLYDSDIDSYADVITNNVNLYIPGKRLMSIHKNRPG